MVYYFDIEKCKICPKKDGCYKEGAKFKIATSEQNANAGTFVKDGTGKDFPDRANIKALTAGNDGYGVYIGLDDFEKLKKLSEKDSVIVIEGQSFTAGQIKKLKSGGRRVYSYIDVGSLETYRPYYNKFKDLALDSYENWPDEYWIDVSDKSWQNYIAGKVAGDLVKKGVAFRDAHRVVGELVAHCLNEDKALLDLNLEELKRFHPAFEADVFDDLSMRSCVDKRRIPGAPAPDMVRSAIESARKRLEA